ncbi:MAG: metal-dependent hydrolase, partial [Geminicoccaceae bacterium]|nr:metal-dependent hydrolase [Geminicoccaceae bacterium]
MRLTWLGHSAVHLEAGGKSVLIDPFLTGNPKYPAGWEDRLSRLDAIVLTHGHDDHVGDTVRLAKKYGAVLVAQWEICMTLAAEGVEKLEPMNTGGCVTREGVRFCMVPALHSSARMADGRAVTMGDPAGFVITIDGTAVYHAGDTALFSDMALILSLI